MVECGMQWAERLRGGGVIALFGELGAGKTTFVKGVAAALGIPEHAVSSPTFTYLHIYEGSSFLYHFDLYRMRGPEDFFALGFDEYLACGVVCIEWAERLGMMLPEGAIRLQLAHKDGAREITHTY